MVYWIIIDKWSEREGREKEGGGEREIYTNINSNIKMVKLIWS